MRPWVRDDHPVLLQHWGLVQRRLRLRNNLRRPVCPPNVAPRSLPLVKVRYQTGQGPSTGV